MALAQEPYPRGHEIYNFDIPFLGHDNYTLILSVLCLGEEKKIFKEMIHFTLIDLYDHTPAQDALPWGIIKFTNLVDPS